MKAVRLHPAPSSSPAYSPSNPAPPSALRLDDIPTPKPSDPDDILVQIKAATVIRDSLTWPETYEAPYAIPGNDFAGIVEQVGLRSSSSYKPGDAVFGMSSAERASTWAEYALIKENELALKPENLSWEEAAALPLSALTAYEALFEHAGIPVPNGSKPSHSQGDPSSKTRLLITGAAGGVGTYLVQLAALAGLHVVAASSSNSRNGDFLTGHGADEVVEYAKLSGDTKQFDVIIDTVGGGVLINCWSLIRDAGTLISVDSASFDFVKEHKRAGVNLGKEEVKALFFIVASSAEALQKLANWAASKQLKSFVAASYSLAKVSEAYEQGNRRKSSRGKVVLTV